ncbi:MAG TPA: hypothetical protein VKT53_13200 [Candidatus Acidoferrum sp.]|nr:hypothetical protein [Candidatus Acidoferrum sp.]
MKPLSPNKSGLAVGALFGLWHLLWAICVALGFAQWLINFVFWLHFLNSPFTVATFHWSTALFLILVTGVIGFFFGFVFALVWNWLHRTEPA